MISTKDVLHRRALEKIRHYVPGKPIKEVQRELGIDRVIKLASNENPLGPSPLAVSAIQNHCNSINRYPDAAGYYLRRKLSNKIEISPDHIVLGNGSVEIVEQITEAYLNPGDAAIVGWPAFFKYIIATQIMDGRVVKVPLRGMKYDLQAMADAVTSRTRIIFIANPNNPTGTMVTGSEITTFMKQVPEEVIVVFDEAYREYVESEEYPDPMRFFKEGRNVVILRTFSKIYGLAGTRIGYGIAKPDIISSLNRVRETFNTNSLAQIAAIHALDDTEHLEKSRAHNREEKTRLEHGLEELGFDCTASVANFILVDMGRDTVEIYKKLLQEGVIVRPMIMYELPTSMRITVGRKDESSRLLEVLSHLL